MDVIFAMLTFLQQLCFYAHEDGAHCPLVLVLDEGRKHVELSVYQPPAVAFTAFTDMWPRAT